MSSLYEKELGAEGKLGLMFEGGIVKMSVMYDGKGADAELTVSLDSDYFLDLLAEAIPGTIDDSIIELLKGAAKIGIPKETEETTAE